jgi:feruloyl esterase
MTAMINWVEGRTEPRDLLARHIVGGTVTFTRTLCTYPLIARYKGTGSPNAARSFGCYAGPRGVPETGSDDGLQLP